eukprot:8865008-Pyramimonas_sp.AAC.1
MEISPSETSRRRPAATSTWLASPASRTARRARRGASRTHAARTHKPRVAVLENVRSLLHNRDGEDICE